MMSGMVAAAIAFWAIIVGVSTMGFVALARGKRKERDDWKRKAKAREEMHDSVKTELTKAQAELSALRAQPAGLPGVGETVGWGRRWPYAPSPPQRDTAPVEAKAGTCDICHHAKHNPGQCFDEQHGTNLDKCACPNEPASAHAPDLGRPPQTTDELDRIDAEKAAKAPQSPANESKGPT